MMNTSRAACVQRAVCWTHCWSGSRSQVKNRFQWFSDLQYTEPRTVSFRHVRFENCWSDDTANACHFSSGRKAWYPIILLNIRECDNIKHCFIFLRWIYLICVLCPVEDSVIGQRGLSGMLDHNYDSIFNMNKGWFMCCAVIIVNDDTFTNWVCMK